MALPVRWSPLKVKDATDKVETVIASIMPALQEAKGVIAEAEKMPNLPDYIKGRMARLEGGDKEKAGVAMQQPRPTNLPFSARSSSLPCSCLWSLTSREQSRPWTERGPGGEGLGEGSE